MMVFFGLDASKPCGTTYRLAIGWIFPPRLASMVFVFARML